MTSPGTTKPTGSLQRSRGSATTAVPRSLRPFEDDAAARRIQRLADQDIVLELQFNGFDRASVAWQRFAEALVEYGYAVFSAWGMTGLLRRRASQHANGKGVRGWQRIPENLPLTRDQTEELAGLLITRALEAFRLSLANPRKTWRVDGGASIKTYFIGGCLMELPDVVEPWWRDEQPILATVGTLDNIPAGTPSRDDPARTVEDRARLEAAFDDPLIREMFVLKNRGYSRAEIADLLSASTGEHYTTGMVRTAMTRNRPRPP